MNKLNLTTQRKAVLELLRQSDDHPTASEIIERLRSKGHNFAYGTIYNSLRYLTEMGVIRELKLDEAASRYDARLDDHHHIVCQRCGRLDEVQAEAPSDWIRSVEAETGYLVDHSEIVFRGVCSACRAQAH
ncbi:Fur family transcriptional regulator [Paenibacillus thermotolerans]|uniref:Fur family transcriptional regulator n=1 Tax=Paenibacillus thermotolerans TaxID=3027807 RepID=UPI0023677356|nr:MULTISPECIES: transcriptional repressor [unclassified Paenibacillus]